MICCDNIGIKTNKKIPSLMNLANLMFLLKLEIHKVSNSRSSVFH